jgi:hypothetical protein
VPMREEHVNDLQTTPEAELLIYIYLPVPQSGKGIPDALAGGTPVHGYCVAYISLSYRVLSPVLPPEVGPGIPRDFFAGIPGSILDKCR